MFNMENVEEIMQILDRFTRLKQKEIPKELDDYLDYVAKTGDTIFKWSTLKYLFREKLLNVIKHFHDTSPRVDDLPQYPNVDPFNYESMKSALLERLELFNAAPFTVQRLCELLIDPRKQYSRIDKFMRALEKNILVSTIEPGRKRAESENGDSLDSVVNGELSLDVNVDVDMENESIFNTEAQNNSTNLPSQTSQQQQAKQTSSIPIHKADDDILPNPKKPKLDIEKSSLDEMESCSERNIAVSDKLREVKTEHDVFTGASVKNEIKILPDNDSTIDAVKNSVACPTTTTLKSTPICTNENDKPESGKTMIAELEEKCKNNSNPVVKSHIMVVSREKEFVVSDTDKLEQRDLEQEKSENDTIEETIVNKVNKISANVVAEPNEKTEKTEEYTSADTTTSDIVTGIEKENSLKNLKSNDSNDKEVLKEIIVSTTSEPCFSPKANDFSQEGKGENNPTVFADVKQRIIALKEHATVSEEKKKENNECYITNLKDVIDTKEKEFVEKVVEISNPIENIKNIVTEVEATATVGVLSSVRSVQPMEDSIDMAVRHLEGKTMPSANVAIHEASTIAVDEIVMSDSAEMATDQIETFKDEPAGMEVDDTSQEAMDQ